MFSKVTFNLTKQVANNISLISRHYAFKSDLKIKWIRPTKIPCYKPEISGDLSQNKKIPPSTIQLEYQNSKELETADEMVKRLFTLEFAPRKRITELVVKDNIEKVQRHLMDGTSVEAKIAKWTGQIRSLQEVMERFPRNKVLKVRLKELIEKRKKRLKYLRKWDYKRFEWLLEKLDLVYKPVPNWELWHKVTRKDSLRRLTDLHCENIKKERLDAYRAILEEEQPAFLQEKIKTLEFIRKEQQDCGAPVTVEQSEIDEVKELLNNLMKQREKPVEENQ